MKNVGRVTTHYLLSAIAIFCVTTRESRAAGIALVDIFKNISYTQSSGTAPTTPSGFFADVELTSQNPGDFNTVTVTYPGPASPITVPIVSPTFFSDGPGFATKADMDAAIPFGTYDFTTDTGAAAELDYTTDVFTADIPALTAPTFNALNGLDPTTALTLAFNAFTPDAGASQGFTFFSISDASGTVFTGGFLAPSATSLLLPAGTLAANTTYNFELDFSDRINGVDPNGTPALVGSDVRTDGTFTTGSIVQTTTPEPGTLLLLGCGILAVAGFRQRATRRGN